MRILVVNPNISTSITETIAAAARTAASPGTKIEAATAAFGAPYISTRSEDAIAAHAVLDVLARESGGCDAAVVAAFTDPGLAAARELMPMPVVGMAEAAMLTACMLGSRFSIITIVPRLVPAFREMAERYGLGSRLASIRAVARAALDIAGDKGAAAQAMLDIGRAAVAEDGAEVVVLGGAPLSGLTALLSRELPVPLLDGVSCAVWQAELLVRLGAPKPAAGSYAPPDAKELVGISPNLAAMFRRGTDDKL